MEFNYLDIKDCRNLVKDMFILSFNKEEFKKIVGLTPDKFIKMTRFNNLMTK